jgi:uncharacterized membrane protein
MNPDPLKRRFPVSAGILFGLGLGGFFDGIVLHQLLQWHHMLSSWYPITDLESLELNTFWDGVFHSTTYLFVIAGLFILWRAAHRKHLAWSNKMLVGTLLLGFGLFNTVEGLVSHQLLGIHHVNELGPRAQWIVWDMGFILWGVTMLVAGWRITRAGRREMEAREAAA